MKTIIIIILASLISIPAYAEAESNKDLLTKLVRKGMIEGCKGSKEQDYFRGFCEGITAHSVKYAKELNLCFKEPFDNMTASEISYIVGSHISKQDMSKGVNLLESLDGPIINAINHLFKCK